MQRRSSAAVASLSALAIPRSREMSALLSSGSAPHTPTKRADPLPLFSVNPNRYSTDSWNSSNFDCAEEMECEWKPEQIRFLSRTLDNLPAHLLTPFIGSVPPSNLLDKIARRVSEAKGNEWPHSLRATRAKIVELGRIRAKEARDGSASETIAEEGGSGSDAPLQQTTNIGVKRPLYRQSSMDFMHANKPSLKDNANINRLSRRLQRTDRILTSPPYKSYARSPSPSRRQPYLNPSTPSSTTLNSGSSTQTADRRSISSLSSASDQPVAMAVRRIRRSDTFAGSTLGPHGLKRAPSFGNSSRNSLESVAMSIDFDAKNSDATSSDEEERMRTKNAKRVRRKASSPAPASPVASQKVITTSRAAQRTKATPRAAGTPVTKSNKTSTEQSHSSRSKGHLQRNPSIFGGELPAPQPNLDPPAVVRANQKTRVVTRDSMLSPGSPSMHSPVPSSPYNLTHIPPMTPHDRQSKTLRRSRPTAPLPRVSLSRKISFGNLASSQDEPSSAAGLGLGSAFQLH